MTPTPQASQPESKINTGTTTKRSETLFSVTEIVETGTAEKYAKNIYENEVKDKLPSVTLSPIKNLSLAGKTAYYFEKTNSEIIKEIYVDLDENTILRIDIYKVDPLFDQILSTFKFTNSPELSLKYPITNNPEKNLYLVFPKSASLNKNVITLGNSSFLISTSVGPGLCPMDSEGDSCTYTDQPGSKWSFYRVWTKSTQPFAINPQVITIDGIRSDGLIITKSTPSTYFSEAELNQWKEIINSLETGK